MGSWDNNKDVVEKASHRSLFSESPDIILPSIVLPSEAGRADAAKGRMIEGRMMVSRARSWIGDRRTQVMRGCAWAEWKTDSPLCNPHIGGGVCVCFD
jgi:hypothetical protein